MTNPRPLIQFEPHGSVAERTKHKVSNVLT